MLMIVPQGQSFPQVLEFNQEKSYCKNATKPVSSFSFHYPNYLPDICNKLFIKVEGANSSSGSPVTDLVDTLVQKMEELRAEPEADRWVVLN